MFFAQIKYETSSAIEETRTTPARTEVHIFVPRPASLARIARALERV